MGKPSSVHRSRSENSLIANPCKVSTNKTKTKMNSKAKALSFKKVKNERRKTRNRTDKNIKKLFDNLRNNSYSSFGSDFSNTNFSVIDLETSSGVKRIGSEEDTAQTNNNKRRKINAVNDSFIIIDDNELNTTHEGSQNKNPVVQCSTPIPNKDVKVLQNFIISDGKKSNDTVSQNLNEDISNLTKTINGDSFVTIDLTTETVASNNKTPNTVIDLVNTTENQDCTVISISHSNFSMSGDSDVTVLHEPKKVTKQMRRFANGIAKLDVSEKERLLDLITQNILGGCNVHSRNRINTEQPQPTTVTEPAEHAYIKEVIVGQTASRNSIGSNIYNPERDIKNKTGLRMIVIDGSNVAMEHGRGKVFSVKGLRICIDYFIKRGHVVKAFVPRFRCKFGKSSEPRVLDDLERRGLVVYTPSREIQGRTVAAYDDRYIVQCAAEFDGVIVSGDNYRDLLLENPRWRSVIETRVLPFTWVEDMIMFPRDPMGRNGPTLEQFLRHPPPRQN